MSWRVVEDERAGRSCELSRTLFEEVGAHEFVEAAHDQSQDDRLLPRRHLANLQPVPLAAPNVAQLSSEPSLPVRVLLRRASI